MIVIAVLRDNPLQSRTGTEMTSSRLVLVTEMPVEAFDSRRELHGKKKPVCALFGVGLFRDKECHNFDAEMFLVAISFYRGRDANSVIATLSPRHHHNLCCCHSSSPDQLTHPSVRQEQLQACHSRRPRCHPRNQNEAKPAYGPLRNSSCIHRNHVRTTKHTAHKQAAGVASRAAAMPPDILNTCAQLALAAGF